MSGRIQAIRGIAPVSVRCTGKRTARGAVVIYPDNRPDVVDDGVPPGSYGGVDLVAAPKRQVTVRILISPKARALLERKHRLLVNVLVELKTPPAEPAIRNAIPLVLG